jgi:hypothetical protein
MPTNDGAYKVEFKPNPNNLKYQVVRLDCSALNLTFHVCKTITLCSSIHKNVESYADKTSIILVIIISLTSNLKHIVFGCITISCA